MDAKYAFFRHCCVPYARPSLTEWIDNNAAANRTTTDAGGYSQPAAGGRRGAAFNFRGRRRGEPPGGDDRRAAPLTPCLTVRPKEQGWRNRAHRGTCWNQGRRDYAASLAYMSRTARVRSFFRWKIRRVAREPNRRAIYNCAMHRQ